MLSQTASLKKYLIFMCINTMNTPCISKKGMLSALYKLTGITS